MISWLLRRFKLVLWLMALSPLALLGWGLYDQFARYPEQKLIFDTGTEVSANIDGGTRTKRRRSGTSFSVNLTWKDKAGKTRTAEKVSIGQTLADKIIRDDQLIVDTLKIKYVEADETVQPLVLAEMAPTGPSEPVGYLPVAGSLPLAFTGGGILYWLRRRAVRALRIGV
jgi:hypothetical protein